jgi:uncharacterized protein (DUF433 family)
MTTTILNISEIISDPKIRGGRPVLAGTGLRVSDIVAHHLYGDKLTPEDLATQFGLNLGQVYAALSYYHLHQAEIDNEMQQNAEEARVLLADLVKQGKASPIDAD